jgi:pyrroline-5-carboxylate reductase
MNEVKSSFGPVAILGGGNLGQAMAVGWVERKGFDAADLVVTGRHIEKLSKLEAHGIAITTHNAEAVARSKTVVIAVQPQQVEDVMADIRGTLDPEGHRIISVATGVTIGALREAAKNQAVSIVRAMPNTAVAIGESMTCLSAAPEDAEALREAAALFGLLGQTLAIEEEMMTPATALCACGVAFFLRSMRAASQGGIEIGFHPEEALLLAAQTARGAASLLLQDGNHPEPEIDRVTTPRGCTIAGLNEMEHRGFSSAMIRGIVVSARKAEGLPQSGEAIRNDSGPLSV